MRITKYMDGKIPVSADADTWGLVELMLAERGGPFRGVDPAMLSLVRELRVQGVTNAHELVVVQNAEMRRH